MLLVTVSIPPAATMEAASFTEGELFNSSLIILIFSAQLPATWTISLRPTLISISVTAAPASFTSDIL
jgi:hypothetical protein